jgi:hypothetical protein
MGDSPRQEEEEEEEIDAQVATRVFSAVIGLAFCVHCFLAYKDLKKTTKRK